MGIVRATKKSWVSKSKVLAHCANKMIFCSSQIRMPFLLNPCLSHVWYHSMIYPPLLISVLFYFFKKNLKIIFIFNFVRQVGWPLSKRGLSLAKFGYRLERKVEKFRNPATCQQHGPILSKKTLCTTHNPFLLATRMKFHQKQNHCL